MINLENVVEQKLNSVSSPISHTQSSTPSNINASGRQLCQHKQILKLPTSRMNIVKPRLSTKSTSQGAQRALVLKQTKSERSE